MTPITTAHTNAILGAPENWDQSRVECVGLPICQGLTDGQPVMQSYWEPTREELEALLESHRPLIRLTVFGTAHPPVWLEVA